MMIVHEGTPDEPGVDENMVAYAAGLFDGEGCILITHYKFLRGRNCCRWRMSAFITNTNPRPLILCKQLFGGSVFSKIKSAPEKNHRAQWKWEVHSRAGFNFLKKILKYSIIKKDEIIKALEFGSTIHEKRGGKRQLSNEDTAHRHAIKKELSDLKRREYVDLPC